MRETLSNTRRVMAVFGRTLNDRKATVAEPAIAAMYKALGISASPGGTKKLLV